MRGSTVASCDIPKKIPQETEITVCSQVTPREHA